MNKKTNDMRRSKNVLVCLWMLALLLCGCGSEGNPAANQGGAAGSPSMIIESKELELVKQYLAREMNPGIKIEYKGATAPQPLKSKVLQGPAKLLRVRYRVLSPAIRDDSDQAFVIVNAEVTGEVDWYIWERDKKSKYGVE